MRETALPIPADHPAFAGHFPGHPVLPGVVLLDEALAAMAAAQGLEGATWRLETVKFLRPVGPGEPLRLSWQGLSAGTWRFEIQAEGQTAATGSVTAIERREPPAT